jgi:hypothetical protein
MNSSNPLSPNEREGGRNSGDGRCGIACRTGNRCGKMLFALGPLMRGREPVIGIWSG